MRRKKHSTYPCLTLPKFIKQCVGQNRDMAQNAPPPPPIQISNFYVIDLPGDLIYTENYRATLGHKMNHSFEPNCTEWYVVQ